MPSRPGFIEHARQSSPTRPATERLKDWNEILLPQTEEQLLKQSERCMNCGVPFCHQGCPLGNSMPRVHQLVQKGRFREAYQWLATSNNFPEFTGRLCPALCEASCVLALNREAVTIKQIEYAVIERAFAEGWVKPHLPRTRTGRRVAIVGSGPAGLAAAVQLNSVGHQVSVFEAASEIGGLLRFGIPDFKLDKAIVERRIAIMRSEGIEFITDVEVGAEGTSWTKLRDSHDAVLIAVGAQRPRDLQVSGRDLSGIHFAMDFLVQQNQNLAAPAFQAPAIDAKGKRVIILGGGDTGADCLGTALRQGAREVMQLELLPAPPETRLPSNPWPQWPLILRSGSSHEEGGSRDFAVITKCLEGHDGQLQSLHAARVETKNDEEGKMELHEIPGSEFQLPVDLLILAMGFTGLRTDSLYQQLGIELAPSGTVKTDCHYATKVDGVFAAGDARRGASLVVWAIAEGREAAREVDRYLNLDGETPLPPRGVDHPFR